MLYTNQALIASLTYMPSESQLISIKHASRILGVTPLTLRNWDKNGKLKALRHPLNNYRVYRRSDVEKLVSAISEGSSVLRVPSRIISNKKKVVRLSVRHLDEYGDRT